MAVPQLSGGTALQRCDKRFLFIGGFSPRGSGFDFLGMSRAARNIETMLL